jgi:hypothetical protein
LTSAALWRRQSASRRRGQGAGVIRVWWGSWLPAQRARRTGEEATRTGEVCGQEGKTGNEKKAERKEAAYPLQP